MNFILFNVILLVAGFVAVMILSVGVMACLAPMALFARSGNYPPRVVSLPLTGIGAIYQVYVWGGWAAFCVAMTIRFTQNPEVTWDWLYWIAGFMACVSPFGWLTQKELQGSRSLGEARGIQNGTMLYSLLAVATFLVFAFAPSLIQRPYGWALTPLGFDAGGSARATPVERGADSPREYVDQQYQFAFQFPPDWKIEKNPPPGDAGEIRAIVRHPTKPMRVMATVGQLGRTLAKRQFESSPNRDAAVEAMIQLSVELYKKASRDIGAESMVVTEQRVLPSDSGISFYISTAHIKGNVRMLMAGVHIVPFEKPYMVTFMMITPVDATATADNETITRVFNSFHVRGAQPTK